MFTFTKSQISSKISFGFYVINIKVKSQHSDKCIKLSYIWKSTKHKSSAHLARLYKCSYKHFLPSFKFPFPLYCSQDHCSTRGDCSPPIHMVSSDPAFHLTSTRFNWGTKHTRTFFTLLLWQVYNPSLASLIWTPKVSGLIPFTERVLKTTLLWAFYESHYQGQVCTYFNSS